jgi:hypothetical protein
MKDREKMAICRYHGLLPDLCNNIQLDGRGHGLLVRGHSFGLFMGETELVPDH